MEIKKLGMELERWAAEKGWKTITPMITAHHSGGLLESLSVQDAKEYSRRLHNNAQIIKRAFRGDSLKYRRNAEALSYAVKAAMNAELEEGLKHRLMSALSEEWTFSVKVKKVLILLSAPVNLNHHENNLCAIPFNHYYHLSNSGGITFAIFPPVRRALPVTIQ